MTYATTSPTERVAAILRVRAFGFGTDGRTAGGAQILQFPFPYTVDGASRLMRVQQGPDPANRSERLWDEDFIMLDVNLVGGGTTRMIRTSTTMVRGYVLVVDDQAGGRPDDDICLEFELPEADNLNHRVVLYGDVGARRDFRVWIPPVFPGMD